MSAVNLLDFDLAGLTAYCEQLGEKRFRATQLFRWVHQRGMSDFARMSDLAKSFRDKLGAVAAVRVPAVLSEQASSDGTIKWLFDVGHGDAVEAVFIPEDDRGTLCVSSQAGCAVGCRFCSTGHQGFSRNLSTSEIVGQLWFAEHHLRQRLHLPEGTRAITNVVMMGMGEPLHNYDAVMKAMSILCDEHGFHLPPRRVTLSTVGLGYQDYTIDLTPTVDIAVAETSRLHYLRWVGRTASGRSRQRVRYRIRHNKRRHSKR